MVRSGEFATIARLAERFREGNAPGIVLGIGDDAAVLEPPREGKLVWTIDEQVEGTHFRRELAGWQDIGWRSFMAAASDLAAMGADPWCALIALSLPADLYDEELDALSGGQHAAALKVGAQVVGGNMTRGEAAVVTTTLLGTCGHAVSRKGARSRDGIWIAGDVGLAAAGLVALERATLDERFELAVRAWLRPVARIGDGARMSPVAHAAIDVSDGLAQDLAHLAATSGVCALLDEAALRAHAASAGLRNVAELLSLDELDLMLDGGEDYALVVASDQPIEGFWHAGSFREGEGVMLVCSDGSERELTPHGFDHFR